MNLQVPTWVVVKIMVPLWVPIIIRHLFFRVPQNKVPLIFGNSHMSSNGFATNFSPED